MSSVSNIQFNPPVELWSHIFSFCTQETLRNVTLVSVTFFTLSSPTLYAHALVQGRVRLEKLLGKEAHADVLPHLSEFVSIRQIKTLTYVPHQDGSAGVTLERLNASVSPPLKLKKLTIDLKKVPWGIPRVVTETFLCSCDPLQFEVSGLGLISMIQLPAALPWKRIEGLFFRDAYTEDVLLEGGLPFSNPVDLFFAPTGLDPDSPEHPLIGPVCNILKMLPGGKRPSAHIKSTHIWTGDEDVLALTKNALARTKGHNVQCDLKREYGTINAHSGSRL